MNVRVCLKAGGGFVLAMASAGIWVLGQGAPATPAATASSTTSPSATAPAATAPAPAADESAIDVDRLLLDLGSDEADVRQLARARVKNLPPEAYPAVRDGVAAADLPPAARAATPGALRVLAARHAKWERRVAEADWLRRRALAEYDRSGPHPAAWDAAAREALSRLGMPDRGTFDAAARRGAFRRAVEAGCDDPVVVTLEAQDEIEAAFPPIGVPDTQTQEPAKYERDGPTTGAPVLQRQRAAVGALGRGEHSPYFRCLAAQTLARLDVRPWSDWDEGKRTAADARRLLPAALREEGCPPGLQFDRVLRQHLLEQELDTAGAKKAALEKLVPLYADAAPGTAGPSLFAAQLHIDEAWRFHDGVLAADQPPNREALKADHLAVARAALEEAAKLDRLDGKPAALAIAVLLLGEGDRDAMEAAFRRAMEVDPDNAEACDKKVKFLSGQWHGSDREMLDFGREQLKTENFRGRVAWTLVRAHTRLSREGWLDAAGYFRDPAAWDAVRETYDLWLTVAPGAASDRTAYARLAYLTGRYADAKRQVDLLGDQGDPTPFGGQAGLDRFRLEVAKRARVGGPAPLSLRPAGPPVSEQMARAVELGGSGELAGSNGQPLPEEVAAAVRAAAAEFPAIDVAEGHGKATWNRVTLAADGGRFGAVRFRTPKGERVGVRLAFVRPREQAILWSVMPVDGQARFGRGAFVELPAENVLNGISPGDGGPHTITLQQWEDNRFRPDAEYLLWFRFRSAGPVPMSVAVTCMPTTNQSGSTRDELAAMNLRWRFR